MKTFPRNFISRPAFENFQTRNQTKKRKIHVSNQNQPNQKQKKTNLTIIIIIKMIKTSKNQKACTRLENFQLDKKSCISSLNSQNSTRQAFWKSYIEETTKLGQFPLLKLKKDASKGILSLQCQKISQDEWLPIFQALQRANDLVTINITIFSESNSHTQPWNQDHEIIPSNNPKSLQSSQKLPPRPKTSHNTLILLAKHLQQSVQHCSHLTHLSFEGAALLFNNIRKQKLDNLSTAIAKSQITHLSFQNCRLGNETFNHLCRSLKHSKSLKHLNFTNNHLTKRAAKPLQTILQHQQMNRDTISWMLSLRYQPVDLKKNPQGLQRLTLNNNEALKDEGLKNLIDSLPEDSGLLALDLQNCGLTTLTVHRLEACLQKNSN
eukprot:Sdes_comp10883_c1_seq1m2541